MSDTQTQLWANLLNALNQQVGNNQKKKRWAERVAKAANNLKASLNATTSKEIPLGLKVVNDQLIATEFKEKEGLIPNKLPDSKSAHAHELSGFLSSIGESVVMSQENLDKESINYLKRLKDNDTHSSIIPPTVFRIPKLKASLKLGIETTESSKLNVLVFGKEEESKMINQQSVELEIAAVPASAEMLQSLESQVPQIQFVLNFNEREFIFQNIKTSLVSETDNIKKGHYGDMLDPKNRKRVIFWRTTKNKPTDPDTFLVLYAGKKRIAAADKPKNIGLWQLQMITKKKQPSIKAIIRYDLAHKAGTQQDQSLLYNYVAKLADRQEVLLRS